MTTVHLLAGIAWDPQIRGFLAVLVGVVVLMGSVYLLLGTNLGARLGFLVAISAIFGWCTIMGITWWVYGNIGMLGEAPHWVVEEIVYQPGGTRRGRSRPRRPREGPPARHSVLPSPEEIQELDEEAIDALEEELADELGDWEILAEANPAFGEAKATVDEHFVATPLEALGLEGAADYVTVYSFETGGKDDLPTTRAGWIASPTSSRPRSSSPRTPPATPSSRCSRSSSRRASPARRRPPPRPTRTSPWCR